MAGAQRGNMKLLQQSPGLAAASFSMSTVVCVRCMQKPLRKFLDFVPSAQRTKKTVRSVGSAGLVRSFPMQIRNGVAYIRLPVCGLERGSFCVARYGQLTPAADCNRCFDIKRLKQGAPG
jgi:hypothetical protein